MRGQVRPYRVIAAISLLALLAGIIGYSTAGNLEPDAPPASTMKTLDEVEPRIPISSVPITLNTPGSYYLTGNLVSTGTAITVVADNVTIDLNGFTLTGPGSGSNYGISMDGRSNVEIRNGTIRGFGSSGVNEYGYSGEAKNHRVMNVRAISNGGYGIGLEGHTHLVKDCVAAENGNDGIFAGSGSTVDGNIAYDNGDDGIATEESCTVTNNVSYSNNGYGHGFNTYSGCVLLDNAAYGNSYGGINSGGSSTITRNTAFENQGVGILGSMSATITYNTARSNNQRNSIDYAGITGNWDTYIRFNTATNNNQYNIYAYNYSTAVEGNLATGSNGYGIYFGFSGCFYANNRASGNATANYGGSVPGGSGDGGGNVSF